jgi:flagellar assembly protein FliH
MSMQVMNTRRFLFDRDLAAEEVLPPDPAGKRRIPTPEEAVEAALHKARLEFERRLKQADEAAYERGLAEGREQGIEQGRRLECEESEQRTRRHIAAIAEHLQVLRGDMGSRAQQLEEEAGAFVAKLVGKLLPGLEAKLASIRLDRFVRDALAIARNSPVVLIRTPADGDGALERALRPLLAEIGHAGTVEIKKDATLGPGALSVSWGSGGIALDPARTAREIVAICSRELGLPDTGDDASLQAPHPSAASPAEFPDAASADAALPHITSQENTP